MGSRILTSGSARPHFGFNPGIPVTTEPRIVVHWDGTDSNKQNNTLAANVVWVNAEQLIRYGQVNMGLQFQSLNSGGTIAIAGSFSPGKMADMIKNDATGNAWVAKEDPNFQVISATLATGASVNSTIIYTLLRITFPASPCTLQITAM